MSSAIHREPDIQSGAPSIAVKNDVVPFDHRSDEDILGLRLVQMDDLIRSGVSLRCRNCSRDAGLGNIIVLGWRKQNARIASCIIVTPLRRFAAGGRLEIGVRQRGSFAGCNCGVDLERSRGDNRK
jgi:hypothetical protein